MESSENIDLTSSSRLEPDEIILIDHDETNNPLEVNPSCSSQTSNEASKNVASQSNCEINQDNILVTSTDNTTEESGASGSTNCLDCPICLQPCIHPARLPCGHIFCFLCIKGVAYKNQRCAMCRREIPSEFLERPQLVNGIEDICKPKCTEDGYQWFYEGRNGWWQYDIRTCQDIEDAYKKGEKSCTILVAGYVYIVDLEAMVQQRQSEPTRCRRVKRDLANVPKKGVAGLRFDNNAEATDASNSTISIQQNMQQQAYDSDLINEGDIGNLTNTMLSVNTTPSSVPSNDFLLTLYTQGFSQTSNELNTRRPNSSDITSPTEMFSTNISGELNTNSNIENSQSTTITTDEGATNFISNTVDENQQASGLQLQSAENFENILSNLQQMSLRTSPIDDDSIERRESRHINRKRF